MIQKLVSIGVMKLKKIISFVMSIVICGAFVTTVFAEPFTNREISVEKFSESLLDEYEVSRERINSYSDWGEFGVAWMESN